MARIKLNVDGYGDFYHALPDNDGAYSLSEEEYAEYRAVWDRFEEWQDKLAKLRRDDYVPPPPLTEEELLKRKEARERAAELIKYMNSDAFTIALQTPIEEGA